MAQVRWASSAVVIVTNEVRHGTRWPEVRFVPDPWGCEQGTSQTHKPFLPFLRVC
jgi:hypothetical protein